MQSTFQRLDVLFSFLHVLIQALDTLIAHIDSHHHCFCLSNRDICWCCLITRANLEKRAICTEECIESDWYSALHHVVLSTCVPNVQTTSHYRISFEPFLGSRLAPTG